MKFLLCSEIKTIEQLNDIVSGIGQGALTQLHQYLCEVDDHMYSVLVPAEDLVRHGRIAEKSYLVLKLQWYASLMTSDCTRYVELRRSSPRRSSPRQCAILLETRLRHMEYQGRRGKDHSSEAEFVCDEIASPIVVEANLIPDNELRQSLVDASTDLQKLVDRIWKPQSLKMANVLASSGPWFSKVQLAYRMHQPHIALELWSLSPDERLHKDLLQRTFLHLLAYSGDLQSLKAAAEIDSTCFLNAGIDAFGLSLLAIAALHDRADIFDFLLGLGLSSILLNKEWRNVLALAARLGSEKVVDVILKRDLFAPPIMLSFTNAIESGHKKIAWKLLPSVRKTYQQSDYEMHSAAALASARGFSSLAEALALRTPSFARATTILEALHNVNVSSGQYVSPRTNLHQDILATTQHLVPCTPGQATSSWFGPEMLVNDFMPEDGMNGVATSYLPSGIDSDATIGRDFVLSDNPDQFDYLL